MTAPTSSPAIDVSLLSGLAYACRPDCGLCCYAEPLVAPTDRSRLVEIRPQAELVTRGRFEFLRSYPEGGACRLLARNRCLGHPGRPAPCREFPLTAHVGVRVQATVVLSCPGVDLAYLDGYDGPAAAAPARGFDAEISALRARAAGGVDHLLEASERRRRRIERVLVAQGRWQEEEEVRDRVRERIPIPVADDFPAEDPPPRQDGLALLPLFFDGRPGPVAIAGEAKGWELVELRPTGGIERSLGVVPPPDRPPTLSADAARTLRGYLRYWLERDQLFGVVHLAMIGERGGSVSDAVVLELRRIASVATSRAQVLGTLRGRGTDPLSAGDLRDGIRATDQDLLDRATWGARL